MVPSTAVFGFSLTELIVVIVVALVVIGPKDLPKMLRKLGKWSGQLRRMASDLRTQSGIDDALRTEGLADPINEIRKLARGELDSVQRSIDTAGSSSSASSAKAIETKKNEYRDGFFVAREREYPRDGADAYGALPDNAIVYADGLPRSPLARDPLYMLGDPDGVVPEPPPPSPFHFGDHEELHEGEEPPTEPAASGESSVDSTAPAEEIAATGEGEVKETKEETADAPVATGTG